MRFKLPQEYEVHLPGTGGSASKAEACLQFEYDIKSGSISDLNLTAANKPDVSDAAQILDRVASNDLGLRDLGYFTFSSFSNMSSKGAFFISRLRPKTILFEMKDGGLQELNFKALYDMVKKHGLHRIEKNVLINGE